MGFLDDDLAEGYRLTMRIQKKRNIHYEEARKAVMDGMYCKECDATGWIGHGMGGDTCGKCNGTGEVK